METNIPALMLKLQTKGIQAHILRHEADVKLREALLESPDCEEFLGIYKDKMATYTDTLSFLNFLIKTPDLTANLLQLALRIENEIVAYISFLHYLIEILSDPKDER